MAKDPPPRTASGANAHKCGVLYVVATPIGNLGDLSTRARDVLAAVSAILAEDTRHTAALLAHFGIARPLLSLHEHNEQERVPDAIARLEAGADLALVSDAGTPLVSDPGFRLVRTAAAAGIRVSPVPGACAAIAALSVAGLPSDRFAFEGFLPSKAGARRAALEALRDSARTLLFYEAPHRLGETLRALADVLGAERRAVVARELTKAFETVYRDTLGALAVRAASDADMSRGEIVILVEGSDEPVSRDEAELDRVLGVLLGQLPVRQAADLAAQLTGSSRNSAYKRALALSGRGS